MAGYQIFTDQWPRSITIAEGESNSNNLRLKLVKKDDTASWDHGTSSRLHAIIKLAARDPRQPVSASRLVNELELPES